MLLMTLITGYYEHIRSVDTIREKVLNYILVMARPLVMYENDHPIHWSSVYPSSKVRYTFELIKSEFCLEK